MSELTSSHIHTETYLQDRDIWQQDIARLRGIGDTALSNVLQPLSAMEMLMDLPDIGSACEAVGYMLSYQEESEATEVVEYLSRVKDLSLFPDGLRSLAEGELVDSDLTPEMYLRIKKLIEGSDMSVYHQRLLEQWLTIGTIFTNGVIKGIEEGYIPGNVQSRLDDAVNKTSVRIGDAAYLDILGADGSYDYEDDEIVVRSKCVDICTPVHELTHKISGGTFISHRDTGSNCERSRMGFGTATEDDHTREELDEALTQHIACGILHGDFETFDPDERDDADDVYYEYRKTVAAFLERSNGLIDTKTLIHAYFEDSGPQGSTAARRSLIQKANKAYGPGALTRLETLLGICVIIDDEEFDQVFEDIILTNIISPELDRHGNVTKQGRIGIEEIFPLVQDGSDTFREVMANLQNN